MVVGFRADGITLLEGKNTLTVKATDAKGRSLQKTLTVIRDTKAPVLSGITPSNGYITNNGTIKVAGKVSDSNTCWVYVNGKLTTITNGTFTTDATFTQEGSQQIIVKATDIADNSVNVTINVTIDLSPPLAFTPVANPADWTTNNRPVISFTTTDKITGIDHYELAIDDKAFTRVTSSYKLPTTADGEHLITVKAFDKVGWVTSGTTKVYIDTTAPVISEFKAVPGNQKVIVSWKTADTDVKTYTLKRVPAFKVGSKKVFGPDILQYIDTDVVNLSTYTYSIQAIDHVDNINSVITTPTVKPGLAEVSTSPKTDTKIEYENVTVGVPVGALSTTKTLTVTTVKDADPIVAKSMGINVSPVYSFGASTAQGPVDPAGVQFNKPVLVGIHYTLDQNSVLKYLNKGNLRAYYYNYKDNNWEMIPESFVDPKTDTVYFFTNHFSMFSVQASVGASLSPEQVSNMGVSPGKAYFQNNQVNISYAGGTSSVMAKDFVLPGRGGLDLNISRTYDSGTGQSDWGVDEKNIFSTVFGFIQANEWLAIAKEFIARALDSYLSQPAGAYGFGRGWRINFVWVEKNENGQFVHLPGGGEKKINWTMDGTGWGGQGHGVFECHAGEHFILEQHQTKVGDLYSQAGDGTQPVKIGENWNTTDYLLTTKEGTQYFMNDSGKLLRIVNRLATSEINLTYRGDGKLSYIIDSVGRKIDFTYNGNFIDSITGGGKTVSYSYDNSELVAVNDAGLQTTKYNYEKHSLTTSTQTISAVNIAMTICQFANPAAWVALFVGMLPNERSDDVYYLSNVDTPFQGEYRMTYQEFTGYRYISDALSCTFMYYQTSKVTRFQEIGSAYTKDIAIRYQIDYPNDKPPMIGTCDLYEGTTTKYTKHTFMSFARYSNSIDKDSSYLQYQEERDQNDKMLTAHTVNSYDINLEAPTQVIDQTGGRNTTQDFQYDNWGNITQTTNSYTGVKAIYAYANTNVSSINDSHSMAPPSGYAGLSINSNIHDAKTGELILNLKDGNITPQQTWYKYDPNGNLTGKAVWNKKWLQTGYTYDQYGNITQMSSPTGIQTSYEYSDTYRNALLTKVTLGQLTDADGGTPQKSVVLKELGYDPVTFLKRWEKDARGFVTEHNYDILGREVMTVLPDDTDTPDYKPANLTGDPDRSGRSDNPVQTTEYKDNAQTSTVIDPLGKRTDYLYDSFRSI